MGGGLMRMMLAIGLAAASIAISTVPAKGDPLAQGDKAFSHGDLAKALNKWGRSNKPEALARIASLAEAGKIQDCDPVQCAVRWYVKAALAGHIPSLTNVAILNFNNGFKEVGLGQFQLAARLNDPLARRLLAEMSKPVPEPDLYLQFEEEERQRRLAAQTAANEQTAQAAQALGYLLGCNLGGGCSAASVVPGYDSARPASVPPAYTAIPSYSSNRTYGALPGNPQVQTRPVMPPEANPRVSGRDAEEGRTPSASLCPDGTYVAGRCSMAADGSYVGGKPQMAPNGSYVGGTPRLAPDGTYVGGPGRTVMCPDGSYVSGRCRLMPNGRYVGS